MAVFLKEDTKFNVASTKGDGNCFFHAAFGNNISGIYIAGEAEQMRQEWFKFLNQFQSLKDESMPIALKDQLKKIFNLFLDKPEDLFGESVAIKELASQTKESIKKANNDVKGLKLDIASRFLKDENFRSTIYPIIREANNQENKETPTLQELLEGNDVTRLINEISNDLKNCAFQFCSLTAEQYNKQYSAEHIAQSFFEDSSLYESYLKAITNSKYYVFFEEIPILVSLARIEVEVWYEYEHSRKSEIFVPNQALVGDYQSESKIWGESKKVSISHKDAHFSRVNFNEEALSLKRKSANDRDTSMTKRTKLNIPEDPVKAVQESLGKIKLVSHNKFLDELTVPGGGIKLAEHGSIFQLKLLMLCLWRGAHNKENNQVKFSQFRLATEMPGAEKFDDIAFQYKDNTADRWKVRLIQAKHKEGETLQKIKMADLLSVSDKDAFSLQKYFHSYLKVKRRSQENSIYSVFSNSDIEDVVVITNTNFNSKEEEGIFFEDGKDTSSDSLFRTSKQDTRIWKFNMEVGKGEKIIDKLKVIFENNSDFVRLIESLAAHICNNKQIDKTEIFKEYYYPLVHEILSFNESKIKDTDKECYVNVNNLTQNVKSLSTEATDIRNALIKEMAFRKGTVRIPNIHEDFGRCKLPFDELEQDKLAETLAEAIVNKQKLTIQNFRNYHVVLVDEIINAETGHCKSKFVNSKNSTSCGKFKICLKEHLGLMLGQEITNEFLKNLKFVLAEDFGVKDLSNYGKNSLMKLAEKFANVIKDDKELTVEDFPEFHVGLAGEVIDINTRLFHDIFKNGREVVGGKVKELSAAGKMLRRLLLDEIYNKSIKIKVGVYDKKIEEFDAALLQDLFGSKIRVSKGFITAFKPRTNPVIHDIDLFVKQMQMLLEKNKDQKVIKINSKVKTENFWSNEEFKEFKDILKQLAGYIFINRFNKVRFSTAFFFKSETFPDDVKMCVDKLREVLGNDTFASLFDYELKFEEEFRTCEDGEFYKKLPVLHNDDDVCNFFTKLKFIICYPNRFEISGLLGKEIKDKFKKLDGEAFYSLYYENLHNWMACRIGTFYTAEKAKTFFRQIVENLLPWTIDGLNKVYFAKVSQKYRFKRYCILDEFLSSNDQVLHIVFKNLDLGRARIVQTFLQLKKEDSTDIQKYTRGSIFLHLNWLKNRDFRLEVFEMLTLKKKYNLLIVEGNTEENTVEELSKQLQLVLEHDKKIIFITADDNNVLAKHFRKGNAIPDRSSFNDLEDNKAKKCLLQEEVIVFQEQQKLSFSELLGISEVDDSYLSNNQDCLNKIICAETLIQLMNGEEIKIGGTLPVSKGYDEDYYIPRGFNRAILLCEKIIQRNIKRMLKFDYFVINDSSSTLSAKNVFVFDKKEIESAKIQYTELCGRNEESNIHWLVKGPKELTWLKSRGSVSNLVKSRAVSRSDHAESPAYEKDLVNLSGDRVVIIADAAGTGKSTVLTSLLSLIKENNQNLWVIRIDLPHYTKKFEEFKNSKSEKPWFDKDDMSTAVDFLLNYLLISQGHLKLAKDSERELFKKSCCGQGKIALLFDEFDEISPKYKDIVIDLLKVFKNNQPQQALKDSGVKKLFITTRPSMRALLESELGVFSFALEPFSPQNQFEFFIKFWTKKLELKDLNPEQAKRLNKYTNTVMNIFFSLINDLKFTAIPLHTMMLAEFFQSNEYQQDKQPKDWQGCKEFLYSEKHEPKLPEKLNLCDLYKDFVKKKFYNIYLKDKKTRDLSKIGEDFRADREFQVFKKQHEILALHCLFGEEVLYELFSHRKMEKAKQWIKKNESAELNEGIIVEIINEKPHFIHLTFAEYFVANFLGMRQNLQNERAVQKLIIANILIQSDYKVLRTFLYEYKNEKKLVKTLWNEEMLELLNIAYSYEKNTAAGSGGRNLLERTIMDRDTDNALFLMRVLEEQGYDESKINDLIPFSCYESAIDYDAIEILNALIENADNWTLRCVLHDKLLEKLASDASFCYDFSDYLIKFAEERLTMRELEELFSCPSLWFDLADQNFEFTDIVESLLYEHSISKIFQKYSLRIEEALSGNKFNRDSPNIRWYELGRYFDDVSEEYCDIQPRTSPELTTRVCECNPAVYSDYVNQHIWDIKH